jgi:hypothetical protein
VLLCLLRRLKLLGAGFGGSRAEAILLEFRALSFRFKKLTGPQRSEWQRDASTNFQSYRRKKLRPGAVRTRYRIFHGGAAEV